MQALANSHTVLIRLGSTAAKADVRVRVRRSVVQVQSKDPSISTIVPVAAPDERTEPQTCFANAFLSETDAPRTPANASNQHKPVLLKDNK